MTWLSVLPRAGRLSPYGGRRSLSIMRRVDSNSVCIITQNVGFGGMEIHTLALMGALIERGFRVELIANCYDEYDKRVAANGWQNSVSIRHTNLGGLLYGDECDIRGWRNILRNTRSQTLIFPKGNNNYGQVAFLRVCRRMFEKVIFIEHLEPRARPVERSRFLLGLIPGMAIWWHKRRILSKLGSLYADRIIAVSEYVRERLVDDFGYLPDTLVTIHNGVPWREFVRNDDWGIAFRAKHGIPRDAFVFGMLTRLSAAKGIDVALRALQILIGQHPDTSCCLVIAGEGGEGERLRRLARDLDVECHTKFIGFAQEPQRVVSGFDAILFSSVVEGLPLGLLEGMAAGCIPIVTRVSGMPEAVNSPDVGWVVPPNDPEALCRAMESVLLLSPDRVAQLRRNVARRVKEKFDIASCHQRILEVCGLSAGTAR